MSVLAVNPPAVFGSVVGVAGQKRSFLEVMTSPKAGGDGDVDKSVNLVAPVRNPSTASTPVDGNSDDETDSPRLLLSDSEDDETVTFDCSHLVTPKSAVDSEDIDFDVDEDDSHSIASDHTDDEFIEGTGIPIDYDSSADYVDDDFIEEEDEDDFTATDDESAYFSHPFTTHGDVRLSPHGCGAVVSVGPSLGRNRHKPLVSQYSVPWFSQWGSDRRKNNRRATSWTDLQYFKTPTSNTRLQIASANVCRNSRSNTTKPTPAAPVTHAPPLNPYYNTPSKKLSVKEKKLSVKEKKVDEDEERSRSRRSNRKDGTQRLARAHVKKTSHSLSAPTRPAMKHASRGWRIELEYRAARKTQIKQQVAARAFRTPKHLRPHSIASHNKSPGAVIPALPPRRSTEPDATVSVRHARNFDEFRYQFFERHRAQLENAFSSYDHSNRVAGIRFCPINNNSRAAFMTKMKSLQCSDAEIPLVFHGTHLENMQSICNRGLLVPDPHKNGVGVRNGSAYGVGIYSARNASMSAGYTHSTTSTIFVCAALTKDTTGKAVVKAGEMVVLMEEARICPLFLLDFDHQANNNGRSSLQWSYHTPTIRIDHARALLAKLYSQLRRSYFVRTHTTSHNHADHHSSIESAMELLDG